MDRHELAWAAGFFDGEGWAASSIDHRGWRRGVRAQVNQAGFDGVPAVLIRFQSAVGLGNISGPVTRYGRIDLYSWIVSSRHDVIEVASTLDPWLGSVKRAQFRQAIGDVGAGVIDRPSVPAKSEWLAWAAGLWDGEGCICLLKHRSHAGYFVLEASLTQSSDHGVPEVLERFRDIIALGNIGGPYAQAGSAKPVYRWKLHRTADISLLANALHRWLGPVKLAQASAALRKVADQPALPRGNPAFGWHKTHCVHGHEYATTRIREFVSRGKNTSRRRDSKQCLACLREYARKKRSERAAN